jgi:hypothetical protein
MRRFHEDERGQSLAIILALITVIFLMGSALAAHTSVALRSTVANESQGGDMHAAAAGAELGIWWQRQGNAGDPPSISVNGTSVSTTISLGGGAACPTLSPVVVTGFEHGTVSAAGGGIFSAVSGSGVSADATVTRTGNYSLKVVDGSGASSAAIAVGSGAAVARIDIRLASLPSSNVTALLKLDAASGNDLQLGYQASSRRLTLRFANRPVTLASSTVAAGTWYRIDLRLVVSTNPRTADWEIDGVPQTPITQNGGTSTVSTLRLGSTVGADDFTANYDDVVVSSAGGDFPIGDGSVEGLRPDGLGTSAGPNSFRNDDATVIDGTTPQRLSDDPMTSQAEYVAQQTVGPADYVEVTFDDTSSRCIVGVSALLSYHAAGSSANRGTTRIFDGATERTVFSGDMSVTALQYASAIVAPATAPWTKAAVNGLVARIGYSSDVNPLPYWDGLLLEIATGVAVPATVTVTATAGASTVTTTYLDAGASPPTLLSWSTDR